MECFVVYQLMFLIFDELSEDNNAENVINFISDANPYKRQGETSFDEVIYDEFKKQY